MKIRVYHGGTECVETPVCRLGRGNLDFGQGFYVTDMKEQALQWAITTAMRRKASPIINVYQLDREAILLEARCKLFTAYDMEWYFPPVCNSACFSRAMTASYWLWRER